jgi:hypothetical protein
MDEKDLLMTEQLQLESQDVVTTIQVPPPVQNPFIKEVDESITASASAIESERAIAQVQASFIMAQKKPRNVQKCMQDIIETCRRPSFCKTALYAILKGGSVVRGASIRLAEEIARQWENLDFGTVELSRRDGYSEMQAYCMDLEKNVRSVQNFTVSHYRDTTKHGKKKLTSEQDIYEKTANEGARRLRSRILALIPADVLEVALETIAQTNNEMSPEKLADFIVKIPKSFEKYGITLTMIENRIGKKIKQANIDDINELLDIGTSLKDGMTKTSDWFQEEIADVVKDLEVKK